MNDPFFSDWRSLMGAVQHWLQGGDPYGSFVMADGAAYDAGWFAYPPPVLLLAAPIAFMPWLISGLLVQALAIGGFEYWSRQTAQRVALPWMLLWLPFVQGLVIGQTTLLALTLLMLAVYAAETGRDRWAGPLLALALLKPQVGVLVIAWVLLRALLDRRWWLVSGFAVVSLLLWGGMLLVAGPQIYLQWYTGLGAYQSALPDRPLFFPPLGPLLALLAGWLWWRYGRSDVIGALLLLNTLIYPLSVVYIAVAIAVVVIRWRPDWPWWPLMFSWLIPLYFPLTARSSPDAIALLAQAIIATGLLTGLLPRVPLRLPVHKSMRRG
jgi:hypothetical protein